MKSIAVVAEDRIGLIADISYILGKSSLNLDGLVVDVVGGKAIISLETKDISKAKRILDRNGFTTTEKDAIVVKVSDSLRGADKMVELLESEKVKIQNMKVLSTDSESGIFSISVDKPRKARRVLDSFILGNDAVPY